MSKNISTVTNKLPTVNEGFYTTTSSTTSASAATVGLNSTSGLTNGSVFVGIIEPGAANQQVFTGVVDTSGNQITSVKWTRGNDVSHPAGVTVVDYVTGTDFNLLSSALQGIMNQDGSLKAAPIQTALTGGAAALNGWNLLGYSPNTVTYNGNRSYDLTFNTVDLTSIVSQGMRLRTTRTTAAPNQSTSLNGTSQYWSKTSPAGMTFTDDFTVSAWVKLSSYGTSNSTVIVGRYNGTSGWLLTIGQDGTVILSGYNAASTNYNRVVSYQSIPLNKWIHVAAQLDMSTAGVSATTSYVMLDGVSVPCQKATSGTAPTTLIQAGDLAVGGYTGGSALFPGKIAQVAVYNSKVTQSAIQATISQGLTGAETNLISAYSFSGNANDLNSTSGNNLSSNNGAAATAADAPFGGQADGTISTTLDYAIIQKATFSTNTTLTVQVPEGCTIPTTGTIASVVYSSTKVPYGFPAQRGKWQIASQLRTEYTQTSITSGVYYNIGSFQLIVPVGEWQIYYAAKITIGNATAASILGRATLSTTTSSETDQDFTIETQGNSLINVGTTASVSKVQSVSTATTYYSLMSGSLTGATLYMTGFANRGGTPTIMAENAYL